MMTNGVDAADLLNPFSSIDLNEQIANYMIYLISYFSRNFFIRLQCLKF